MSVSASTTGRASRTRARRGANRCPIRSARGASCYLYTRVMESRVLYGNFSVTSIDRSIVRRPSPVARRSSTLARRARRARTIMSAASIARRVAHRASRALASVPCRACASTAVDDALARHETVVGIEIHARLATRSKLFSGAPSAYGGGANERVAPFDAALPGTLPVLNAGAVALAIKLGLALKGEVQLKSSFDRKHYFYADLPHGYQITQQRAPIVRGGEVVVVDAGKTRAGGEGGDGGLRIGIERVQLEMDTGKSQAMDGADGSVNGTLIDLNRAGQALVEIVSEPDIRSGEDTAACVESLQRMLRYLNVSDANMEEGSLRCDVNVSVRTADERARGVYGERVEIKNLNSLRSIVRAVKHEAKRHVDVIENGGKVERETRTFDANTGKTIVLRSKESLLDYRFTPEPDLPPLVLTAADVEAVANRMPELPNDAYQRLVDHGVSPSTASIIIAFPSTLKYYDVAMEHCGDAKPADVANFVANEIIGAARKDAGASHKEPLATLPLAASSRRIGHLLGKVAEGALSGRMAKQVLESLMNSDERALSEIIGDVCGGSQISNDDELKSICQAVVNDKPEEVALLRSGKNKLMSALVGEVMKRTQGRANPKEVSKTIQDIIAKLG